MPNRDKRAACSGDLPDALGALGAPALQADSLTVLRADRLVLDGVSFTLAAGGALLLVGPNGAGKSTLLRALAGLCPLAAGTLFWQGENALRDPPAHAARIGFLGHADALKPGLTLRENLRLAAILSGRPVDPVLDAFDLAPLADLPARLLSAGQKRRTALARVLLGAAPLWLLDEPSLGLDAAAIDRLGAVLAAHRAQGGMVIATTHVTLPLPGAETLVLGA
ncbi:heme ABC exporter ATP-binding protein CcmA [Acetobacteraceae bacterium KSS8]|uniref:Heme ABC exporter ATP-binding protein CcmA n=1 Tax=Endosaccharibacter trunci TaxID=2812733 RepID=A0ABT1W8R8_9PROT|nr:heme ABC exporter ATP-binding protein CcmA [Acetobacteraceae bacterium KSS8]